MKRPLLLVCVLGFFPGILHAGGTGDRKAPVPPETPPGGDLSHFRVSVGAVYRSIGRVNFSSGSQSGQVRLPFLAVALGKSRPSVGGLDSYADRAYLDGHVRQDAGTGNDGSTWNWGYLDSSQISGSRAAGNQELTFHGQADSATRDERSRADENPGSWALDGDGAVPAVQLDWSYDFKPELSLGVSLQYSLLDFDGRNELNSFNAFQTQSSYEVNVTDGYVLGDVIAPQAPYQGTYEGPGPLINNRPSSRRFSEGRPLDRKVVQFYNAISESLKVRLHQFQAGPYGHGPAGAGATGIGHSALA